MVFGLFSYALFWSLLSFIFVFFIFFWHVWGDEYFSWVGHLGCDVSRRIPYTPFFIKKKIFRRSQHDECNAWVAKSLPAPEHPKYCVGDYVTFMLINGIDYQISCC